MALDLFTFKGEKQSSTLPVATYPGTTVETYDVRGQGSVPRQFAPVEIPRHVLWETTVDATVANIPKTDNPVYIATGGGYGSNNTLIDDLKKAGAFPVAVSIVTASLKGAAFRELPAFASEKEDVRKAIGEHLKNAGTEASPEAVEQVLTAFYSDEVNTRITKAAVKKAIVAKKSVIHESASIYDDTKERAELAQQNGMKAVLIAGDKDFTAAIGDTKGNTNPFNTVTSYKKFSDRFQNEWAKLFDEVYLYNTDSSPPVLIASKKEKSAELVVHNEELYAKFVSKRLLDPAKYATLTTAADVISREHQDRAPDLGRQKQVG